MTSYGMVDLTQIPSNDENLRHNPWCSYDPERDRLYDCRQDTGQLHDPIQDGPRKAPSP